MGLGVLIVGAESLVRGASRLARRMGVPVLVVGLTIVALGTSAPEIAITITSAVRGEANVAIGNAVGSNTFNVLAILGLAALCRPLPVALNLIRIDAPIMILSSIAFLVMASNGGIERLEGLVLTGGLVAYLAFVYWWARRRKEAPAVVSEFEAAVPINGSAIRQVFAVIVGFGMLALGAHWMVTGAVTVARMLGVSDLIIALTIVAAGTGMPELATSVVAGLRKEPDIAVGNIVGSNIVNILGAVGLCAAVAPPAVSPVTVDPIIRAQDGPIMLATLLLLWVLA
ncbi:MAG: calcium/sodium antiporter, partial [Phycisphaerae bacterium]|nr:calcium/sodium antiporter [Phycisphaerae bacterium]